MLATAFTGILPSDFCSRLVSDPSNTVLLECPFNCDDEVNDEAIVYVDDDLLNDCRGFGSGLCSDYSGWVADGDKTCSWIEDRDKPGCPEYGDLSSVDRTDRILATEACCYCGGGECRTCYNTSDTTCVNDHEWTAVIGNETISCEWFEENDDPGCTKTLTDFLTMPDVSDPRKSCCYCSEYLAPTPSPSLTPTNSPPCYDYIGWLDIAGNGCEYYEIYDAPGCPYEGTYYANDENVTASMACCYCNGGSLQFPSAFPTSSYAPSHKYKPTSTPSLTPTDGPPCYDYIGWLDFYGDGCEYYEIYDAPGCPYEGAYYANDENVTASMACCYCNGGLLEFPSAFPTSSYAPSHKYKPTSTPSLTRTDGPSCYDYIGWLDSYGDGCGWYETYDAPGCPYEGAYYANDENVTASMACCYCNGGVLDLLEYDDFHLQCDDSYENWRNTASTIDISGDNQTCRAIHYLFDSSTQSERAYNDLLDDYCEELHNGTMFMSEACCFCSSNDDSNGMTAGDDSCTNNDLQISKPWPERNCEWFGRDVSRCDDFGDETILIDGIKGLERTANDACCVCGGGTQGCLEFIDNWTDSHPDTSFNCNDYGTYNRCAADGSGLISLGHNADTQCCVCGGGYTFENDDVIVNASQNLCIDEKDWESGGLLCADFINDLGAPDIELCLARGHVLSLHGVNASDGCCNCWYGYDAVAGGGYRGILIGKVLRVGMMNYTDIQYVHNLNNSGNIDESSTIYDFIRNASEAYGFGLIQYDLNELNETRGLGQFPDDSYSACLTGELSMELSSSN